MRSPGAYERDRGVRRVSVLTRATVAGAVALSAGFTAVVALAQPARSRARTLIAARRRLPEQQSPATSRSTPNTAASSPDTASLPTVPSDPYAGSALSPPPQVPSDPYGGGGQIVSGQS